MVGSTPPSRKHAVDRELEGESLFDWVRRQKVAVRKPIPPRGITQAAPKKKAPVAADAFETQE